MSEPKLEHPNYIVSSAACLKIGDDFYIIPSVRHFDELFHKNNEIYKLGLKIKYPMLSTGQIHELFISAEQGFIDRFSKFHTRVEAWKIAESAGQIRRRVGGDTTNGGTLYSENLY